MRVIPLRRRFTRIATVVLVICIGFVLTLVNHVKAQAVDPTDRVFEIAKQLNCPTCAGRNLADCPTDTCMQWKQEIRSQIDAGKSNQEVINYFMDRFGPTVLQEPPKVGPVLALWLLPIALLIALICGGALFLRRISFRKPAPGNVEPVSAEVKPADLYAARLEDEVGKT